MSEVKETASITFRGQVISSQEARGIIDELGIALANLDPILTESPAGQSIPFLIGPRWHVELAQQPGSLPIGTLLCLRDPACGWRGFILPWECVASLAGAMSNHLAIASSHRVTHHTNQSLH